MKNFELLIGTLIVSLLLIGGIAFFFSSPTSNVPGADEQVFDQAVIQDGGRNVKGGEEAEITIVEFSDFQCPACKSSLPYVDNVLEVYPDEVALMYRHFPLDSIHPNARLAAIASEVAAGYDKFWEYHDVLFEKQSEWSDIGDRDEFKNTLATYAENLEIDKEQFLERIEEKSVAEAVQSDVTVANEVNVNSTPTFFVEGKKVSAPELLFTVESLLAPESTDSATPEPSEESN